MKKIKASEEFKKGKHNISWVDPQFKQHLYDMNFEKESSERFETRTLPRPMDDKEIAKEFAPEPVSLGFVLSFFERASHETCYIFYVKDTKGALWAVNAFWNVSGWFVYADSVSNPREWRAVSRVVSRRFYETQESESLSPSDTLTRISRKYYDEKTGIVAKIENGNITIENGNTPKNFVFQNSTPETVRKIGEALIRISKLV